MKRILVLTAGLLLAAGSLDAQDGPSSFNSGLKLKGGFHLNRSAVEGISERPEHENGYGAGIEIVGKHLGLGVYGYSAGRLSEFDGELTPVIAVAELNYYMPIERIRVAPYFGIHSALGEFTSDFISEPYWPKPQDGPANIGYQAGLRFKPLPLISLDAQWRRQSGFAFETQHESLERTQILVGVTLF
jgi:hypothetical protein